MKPIDRSKNGAGYLGICHIDNPVVTCNRCGILCKHQLIKVLREQVRGATRWTLN